MSPAAKVILIFALLVPLWLLLRRDFVKGLAYAVFLFVSMTTFLRIELPGALPQLTIHRLILISLFVFWFSNKDSRAGIGKPPLLPFLGFWGLANLISLFLTDAEFVKSLKRFLDYTLEVYAFYFLVASSLRTGEEARKIVKAAFLGLTAVAFLAIVERRTGFNPVKSYLSQGADGSEIAPGIQATYQHRILLGTAMAMGWPLAFCLMDWRDLFGRSRNLWFWIASSMMLASCYFSNSRGPWLAAVLGCGLMWVLGSWGIRKRLLVVACVGFLVVLAKPGVVETLGDRASSTSDSDSFKGGTFRYRLELWNVAWSEITKSPLRLLFGYGPGAGADADLDWELSYRGKTMQISSWDNHFAYDLYQSGCVGFIATAALYGYLVVSLFRFWRAAAQPLKDRLACLFASACGMVFMMTNVLIFSKQLDYLFWSIVACGYVLGRAVVSEQIDDAFEPSALAGAVRAPVFEAEELVR
jgi:hypothetical protein